MALLSNLFPSCQNKDDLIWTYTDNPAVYAKFTQFMIKQVHQNVADEVKCEEVTYKETQIPAVPEKTVKQAAKHTKRQMPMQIIIELSQNDAINTDYIKTSLIDFISKKDFQKLFGVKKTAEVMKGITENKWNKSLVLFLSFMYDTAFVYLNKDVIYDSEKTYDRKIVI